MVKADSGCIELYPGKRFRNVNEIPKVSVIIPIYNVEDFLDTCMKSIINQTLSDIEIICVNDGSTDSSLKIINMYASLDYRIKVIDQRNKGPGVSRNKGFKIATGEYTFFMDSDDFVEPFMLEHMYTEAKKYNNDIIMCRSFEYVTQTDSVYPADWTIDTRYVPLGENFDYSMVGDKILQFSFGWTWDKLYNTEFLRKNKLDFAIFRNSEDLILSFRALFVAERIRIINKRMVYHRIDNYASVSRTREKNCTCFIDSSEMLLNYMKKKGINDYDSKRSYINWAADYAIWNMNNLTPLYRYKVFVKLKHRGLNRLAVSSKYGEDYYFNKDNYRAIKEIEQMPTVAYVLRDVLQSYISHGIIESISNLLR